MFHAIVRRKTTSVFAALNRGDTTPVLAGLAPRVEHVMYGEHALGGLRRDPGTIADWYRRLLLVFPDLQFEIASIGVRGWPPHTTVYVDWHDWALGGSYTNHGVNVIDLAWGKVTAIRIHCDTQAIAAGLERAYEAGQPAAKAAPLLDAPAGWD